MRQLVKAVLLGIMATALIALPATAGNGDDASSEQARDQVQTQVQDETCTVDCDAAQTRTHERDQVRVESGDCKDAACEDDMVQTRTRSQIRAEREDNPVALKHLLRRMASENEAAYIHRATQMCSGVFLPI